jgi:hypothetical protein
MKRAFLFLIALALVFILQENADICPARRQRSRRRIRHRIECRAGPGSWDVVDGLNPSSDNAESGSEMTKTSEELLNQDSNLSENLASCYPGTDLEAEYSVIQRNGCLV